MTEQTLSLTRSQKAAVVLVAMGKPNASRLLKFFKQDELKSLVDAARVLRTIPQADLERIVAEFEDEFAQGAGLLDSAEHMDNLLTDNMSSEEMDTLMGRAKEQKTDPSLLWRDVERLPVERIGVFLAAEHPQTAALILSKLSSSIAAKVLLTIEKQTRGEIMKRMVSLASIPDAAWRIVENQLRKRLLEQKVRDVSVGQTKLANLLNELEKNELDEIMADLEAAGVEDIEAIRSRLFSFEDIGALTQKARALIFDGVTPDRIALALRGTTVELADGVLSAISQRSKRMVEAELGNDAGNIRAEDVMAARKEIASRAISLSTQGLIELPTAEGAA